MRLPRWKRKPGKDNVMYYDEQQFSDKIPQKAIDYNVLNEKGNFPIISAINIDDLKALGIMIANGANVNIDKGDGWTPLHEAIDLAIDGMIQNNRNTPYPEIMNSIKLLLENGADLSLKNSEGNTPLDSFSVYASDLDGFNLLKDMFRCVVQDIDNKVQYIKKSENRSLS